MALTDGLTVHISVPVAAAPGIGLFADCDTPEDCARVYQSLIASGAIDLHEVIQEGFPAGVPVQAFVQPNMPIPQPRPENQPAFDWAPIVGPSLQR